LVFKRRNPKGTLEAFAHFFYPRGGWGRAVCYIMLRIRRLPDPAHKISRGIAAGVFVCFTPLFGLHFFLAAGLAYIMRGNMLAALLATFFGNPLTFPVIASVSVDLGTTLLGQPPLPLAGVLNAFSFASVEFWANIKAIFTSAEANWSEMQGFYRHVFMPYLIGGLIPGVIAGTVCYALSRPLIASYQVGRIKRLKERFERKRQASDAAKAEKSAAAELKKTQAAAEKADGATKAD
jgi:uncharacterized protein (DUF2062 family)